MKALISDRLMIDDPPVSIGGGDRRDDILHSALGSCLTLDVEHDSTTLYTGSVRVFGEKFWATFCFFDNRLTRVDLELLVDSADERNPFSEEVIESAKRNHDAILADALGPVPHAYSWGTIDSAIDPHGSGARIVITYTPSRQHQVPNGSGMT